MDGLLVDENGIVVARATMMATVHPSCRLVSSDVYSEAVVGQPLPWPRETRNRLLAESDFVETPSYQLSLSPADQNAWAMYRSALRILPRSFPDPMAVEWPRRPDGRSQPVIEHELPAPVVQAAVEVPPQLSPRHAAFSEHLARLNQGLEAAKAAARQAAGAD